MTELNTTQLEWPAQEYKKTKLGYIQIVVRLKIIIRSTPGSN